MTQRFNQDGDGHQHKELEQAEPGLFKREQVMPSQGAGAVRSTPGLITDYDIYLFKEGRHFSLYEKLGSHLMHDGQEKGTYFAVWAPNAR